MKKQTHINKTRNKDGSQNVSFYNKQKGWMPVGRLMPPLNDWPYYDAVVRRQRYDNKGH